MRLNKENEPGIITVVYQQLDRLEQLKQNPNFFLKGVPRDYTMKLKIKAKKISPIQIKSLRKKLANLDKNFKTGKVEFWKELKNNESQHNFSFLCPEISSPNGDSFLDQCKRISNWIESLNFHGSEVIVAITHSGVIRAALSHMLGIEPDKAVGIEILPLSVSLFEVLNEEDCTYRGGRFRLLGVNK